MNPRRRILIVSDDEDLRQVLAEQLQVHGEFTTEESATGSDAIKRTGGQYFDSILLDAILSDMDGSDVCRDMRRSGVKSPVIVLTSTDENYESVSGTDASTNYYLKKPFKIGVLLARLRAYIRIHEKSEHTVFEIGPYTFRPAAKIMVDRETEKKVRLTDKETAIMKYLYLAGECVVSRDILLGEVWGYNTGVTTHTLETHVYRLRQKIEREPSNAGVLVTEPSGYRLIP